MIHWKCIACNEALEAPESLTLGVLSCPKCGVGNKVPMKVNAWLDRNTFRLLGLVSLVVVGVVLAQIPKWVSRDSRQTPTVDYTAAMGHISVPMLRDEFIKRRGYSVYSVDPITAGENIGKRNVMWIKGPMAVMFAADADSDATESANMMIEGSVASDLIRDEASAFFEIAAPFDEWHDWFDKYFATIGEDGAKLICVDRDLSMSRVSGLNGKPVLFLGAKIRRDD